MDGVPVEKWKIPGETAIPRGTYRVFYTWSNHFQKKLPELVLVPGYEGVRIHTGNTDKDTEGCLILGTTWAGTDFVGNSHHSFEDLFLPLFLDAISKDEEVWLTIG